MLDLTDDVRLARELAAEMSAWLNDPLDLSPTMTANSDLIEWCRSARDVLARVGKLEEEGVAWTTERCIYWWHDGDRRLRRCELDPGHQGMHQSGQAYA